MHACPTRRSAGRDPDAEGLLDPEGGVFGLVKWQGTPGSVRETLVPQLPDRVRSPAMRNLEERLLLSLAVAPRPDEGADTATKSLLAMRVGRLQALGAVEKTAELLAAAQARNSDRDLAPLEVATMPLTSKLGAGVAEAHGRAQWW